MKKYLMGGAAALLLSVAPAFAGPGTPNGGGVNAGFATSIPAGSNLIGKVGIDQTTPGTTNAIVATPTSGQGVATQYGLQTAAATNSTLASTAAAHTLKGVHLASTSTTVMYLRFYDAGSAPTCSSSTNFIRTFPVPPAASAGLVGGWEVHLPPEGLKFSNGIAFCVTGGASSTDNTNATTGGFINLDWQ